MSKQTKKHIEFIDRLIVDTTNDILDWTKAQKPDIGFTSQYDKWKAETQLTNNKILAFILNHHTWDYKYCELRVFLVDRIKQTKELVMEIDQPGLFDFKLKHLFEILIELLKRKHKDKKDNIQMGPFQRDWEEVVY